MFETRAITAKFKHKYIEQVSAICQYLLKAIWNSSSVCQSLTTTGYCLAHGEYGGTHQVLMCNNWNQNWNPVDQDKRRAKSTWTLHFLFSKSRPELDLKVCIEEFEFGVVPRSLFSLNGCLLLPYDKALILLNLQNLEKILKTSKEGEEKGERKEWEEKEEASKSMIPADAMTS